MVLRSFMSDIALVQPPLEDFYLTGKRTVPYGLLALAAALEKRGFSVTLVDALATAKNKIIPRPSAMDYLEPHFGRPDRSPFALFHHYRHFGYSFAHVAELVSRSGAFLVGISSLFTPYHEAALETARIIKKRLPTCKIVVGGHHATVLPEAVMACAAVDFVLRGEAENSLPRLAALVRQDRETAEEALSAIPGLVWRRPTGVIEPAAPAVVDDLDAQPPPAVHLLKSSFYRRHGRAGAVIVASRGCPLRCSYCAVSAAGGPPYRRRSLAGVMVEIERAICGQGAGFIDFEDENLSLDRGWFMELLAALARLRRDHVFELRAMNGLFPPSLDEPMIAAMAA
ncbi:MAG TPA: radical SAM protein, partial [Proteobacteria bacterium]|nr:radical SAM protein [Pseudomonadota bacterium]